jgi:hypothetical protein
LDTEALTVERLAIQARLDDRRLRLGSLDVVLPGMTLAGDATFDSRPARPVWTADLKAERIDLPEALAFLAPVRD